MDTQLPLSHVLSVLQTATVAELEEAFYDHFNLKISDVHVMVSGPGIIVIEILVEMTTVPIL